MRKTPAFAEGSPEQLVWMELLSMRKGAGLTRVKVAKAEKLLALPVVRQEARRLGRSRDAVAYALVTVTAASLKEPYREILTNAYAIAGTPPGKNLADRRSRIRLSESQLRAHENEAFEELTSCLFNMTDPATLFGNYLAPEFYLPAPDWTENDLTEPVAVDDIHPLGEVIWEQLEKTVVLNEQGFAVHTETRGQLRALIEGVTGYTVFYTNLGNPEPDRLQVIQGGTPGRYHVDPIGHTTALNINFAKSLEQGQTLRLQWLIHLPPKAPDADPETGSAEVADNHTRNLTLRAQFDERRLPVRPLCYVARPRFLLRPMTPLTPLELQPGNLVSYTWPRTDEGNVYVLRWQWPEQYKTT